MDTVGAACWALAYRLVVSGRFRGLLKWFRGSSKWLHRANTRTPPPLEETRDNDEDVVSAYRETGEGWQTRINADLRRARKLNVATGTAPRNAKRAPVAHRNQGQPSEKIGLLSGTVGWEPPLQRFLLDKPSEFSR